MTLTPLSAMGRDLWSALAPALGNHLWQSTLFALAAGLLTLTLRQQRARMRYWIWLVASVKFLIPFSLLVQAGNRLAWSLGWSHASAGINAGLYFAAEQISQPFTQPAITLQAVSQAAATTAQSNLIHLLPAVLAATWLCGFAVVLLVWCARWRRVSAVVREAVPMREGCEVEALRRLERMAGMRPIEMVLSRDSLEPGIFGIARPVLLWPEGISEHLEESHMEAILAHELWHVRRRDNLSAALHMLVEALFWFHPLVWWLGARMVEERERACDEEVVELGSERQVYAESILKVCEFCVGSPLACVSGVTGSDLKKRMVSIMTERIARELNFSRKLLLSTAVLLALVIPIGFGVANATPRRAQTQGETAGATAPKFEVSVKPSELSTPTYAGSGVHMVRMMYGPDGFKAVNASLLSIIQEAYGIQANQIVGPPEIKSAAYDIEVKMEGSPANAQETDPRLRQPEIRDDLAALRNQLQAILADRFKLVLHHENKKLPSYLLVVGENGSKLQPTKFADYPDGAIGPDGKGIHRMMMQLGGGQVRGIGAQKSSMAEFAKQLSMQLGKNVVDKTGMMGQYDFNLQWSEAATNSDGASNDAVPAAGPSLFDAIQEQLGLKLVPQQGPVDVLVIDHVEWPEANSSL
jgi:bla regulator protein blaR1